MAEGSEHDARVGGESAEAAGRLSIGRYLASQRRLRGISLDELASRTKIPRRNLERLESGVFDAQTDGFVRGFVRTVADALGLDPHEAVMRLVGEPSVGDEELRRRRRRRAGILAALLAAMLLLALGWGLRMATRWVVEPAGDPSEHVYRRDAVRSLTERKSESPPRPAPPAEEETGSEAPRSEPEPPGD